MLASHVPIMEYLVETLKVDVNATDAKQRTALFYAVEAGNEEAINYLLKHMGTIKADGNGSYGADAGCSAAKHGCPAGTSCVQIW